MSPLRAILPEECVQDDPKKRREFDSALLFLIHPSQLIDGETRSHVLRNVVTNLQEEYGIRGYIGDSYWAPDYKEKLPPEQRTTDFSESIAARDRLLPAKNLEAQWCIFESVISSILGIQFLSTHEKAR